jgi:hypothetical protein
MAINPACGPESFARAVGCRSLLQGVQGRVMSISRFHGRIPEQLVVLDSSI